MDIKVVLQYMKLHKSNQIFLVNYTFLQTFCGVILLGMFEKVSFTGLDFLHIVLDLVSFI